ncbi:hypothetical protein FSB08_17045 [Paraburkholderia sp. JPY432]|uniref:hypothetical protein n=1 Tax=Paraburkholderia youngii TaxID=2782701 RepID=UPI001595899B|nr:hypothetical protein [Paraburkholderia youngii]NVH74211.1 hypothetical protein [Paraburkholderia youngii]
MRDVAARVAAVIRVDEIWLAVEPLDMLTHPMRRVGIASNPLMTKVIRPAEQPNVSVEVVPLNCSFEANPLCRLVATETTNLIEGRRDSQINGPEQVKLLRRALPVKDGEPINRFSRNSPPEIARYPAAHLALGVEAFPHVPTGSGVVMMPFSNPVPDPL